MKSSSKTLTPKMLIGSENRFWAKVNVIDDETSCWEWKNGNEKDRGDFSVENTKWKPYRVAYVLETGDTLTTDDVLDHKVCDNPKCCRVSHLKKGTQLDNVTSMRVKGRGNTKRAFTDAEVMTIRQRYAEGVSQSVLAEEFDTAQGTVSNIVRGKTFKSLPLIERPKGFNPHKVWRDGIVAAGKVIDRTFQLKLTDDDVREVRQLLRMGMSQGSIANRFDCSQTLIWSIASGRQRANVPDILPVIVLQPVLMSAAD